jgi:hypothetical protein
MALVDGTVGPSGTGAGMGVGVDFRTGGGSWGAEASSAMLIASAVASKISTQSSYVEESSRVPPGNSLFVDRLLGPGEERVVSDPCRHRLAERRLVRKDAVSA